MVDSGCLIRVLKCFRTTADRCSIAVTRTNKQELQQLVNNFGDLFVKKNVIKFYISHPQCLEKKRVAEKFSR